MLRPASRALPRQALRVARPRPSIPSNLRHLTTAPPHQVSRSWKNSAARWGIAIVGLYWYNTTNVFAEEPPAHLLAQRLNNDETSQQEQLPTLDSLSPSARRKREAEAVSSSSSATQIASAEPASASDRPVGSDIEGLEDEAHSEGAFNPETGEINWDCPCLGGMAHGPCGPEFREAFSCFVFSTEEPKGMDCIERFKTMQNCFRLHPDVYGAELEDDEDDDEEHDVRGVGHEDPNVAASSPEDAPHVAALAEKIKEEDQKNLGQTQSKIQSKSPSPSQKQDQSPKQDRALDAPSVVGSDQDAPVSAKNAAPVSNDTPAPRESTDSLPKPSSKEAPPADKHQPFVEDDATEEEAIVPRAAHDARNAPVPKAEK